jgi:G3E family GTPase
VAQYDIHIWDDGDNWYVEFSDGCIKCEDREQAERLAVKILFEWRGIA